jgi:hypothetical protein
MGNRFCLLYSAVIIAFIASLLLSVCLLLAVGLGISPYHVLIPAVFSIAVCWWGSRLYFPQTHDKMFLRTLVAVVATIIALTLVSGAIYDTSWDGQNYHTEAILRLANGWNPFYQAAPVDAMNSKFLGFYAKASWINAAALYQPTGNFEQGKVFNLLLMLVSGLVSYAAFSTFRMLNHRKRVALSLLMAFNPVSVSQMLTFYVDGQLSSCLVILVSLFILLYWQQDRLILLMLFAVMLLTVNVKIIGLLSVTLLGVGYGLGYSFLKRRMNRGVMAALILGYGVGGVFIGYNPYVTQYAAQYLRTGNPFYPTDERTISAIDYNSPSNFVGMTWPEKVLTSLFSKSNADKTPAELKIPFTLSLDEILAFSAADVRVSGFGSFFSGALLLAIAVLAGVFVRQRWRIMLVPLLPYITMLILLSSMTNPEAWWARYVPQLWLFPVMIALMAMVVLPFGRLRTLNQMLIIVLFCNEMLILVPTAVNAVSRSIQLSQQLQYIQGASLASGSVKVNFNAFVATELRFKARDIDYIVVTDLPCPPSQQLHIVDSEARVCLP